MKIRKFLQQETVLCISALCAVATMFFVPPDSTYLAYIDLRVLCLLLCLMAVVAGFEDCGAFQALAVGLLRRSSGRTLGLALVMLPFFSAMLVTNDVALLTFVPFTLLVLEQIGCKKAVIPLVVLQTVAANLGSMATPVGNPQNLFLYSSYQLTPGNFFSAVLPLTALSLVVLAAALMVLPRRLPQVELQAPPALGAKPMAIYSVLFLLSLLAVFRLLPYGIVTVMTVATMVLWQPKPQRLDLGLLATFVCFFIVSGNLGRMETVRTLLQDLMGWNAMLTTVLASQVISNVPAAALLSSFTDQWQAVLVGANIGGLGTPVASLASLISLKLYLRSPGARAGKFLAVFLAVNAVGLALLLPVARWLGA